MNQLDLGALDRLGVKALRVTTPDWANRLLAAAAPLAPPPLARLAPATISRTADTAKAQRCLGFRPLPLEDGVESTIRAGRAAGRL